MKIVLKIKNEFVAEIVEAHVKSMFSQASAALIRFDVEAPSRYSSDEWKITAYDNNSWEEKKKADLNEEMRVAAYVREKAAKELAAKTSEPVTTPLMTPRK